MKPLNKFFDAMGILYVKSPLRYAANENEITLNVPGYRQLQDFSCGAVAGLMVLHTFYPRASARKFWRTVGLSEENGASTGQLTRALKASGVIARCKRNLKFSDINRLIGNGYPIITTTKHSADTDHWMVIYGTSVRPNKLFIAGVGIPGLSFLKGNTISWRDFKQQLGSDKEFLICWAIK